MPVLDTVPFPATVVTLDSGLTLIHQFMPATPVAVADVWVRAGAGAEPSDWAGMAHFLEHMIFKGTERLLPGHFDWAIETEGGMTNAATSHDYAHFYLTIAADRLPSTLPYLADIVLHAAIPADEFGRERQVVLEEILQSQDDPDWVGFQAMSELVYQDHPYGRPVLGTADVLQQRSPEEMRCFHQSYYQPANMAIVITGGVPLEPTMELVNRTFRGFSPQPACPLADPQPVPALSGVRRETLVLPRIEQARLTMAWLTPGITQPEDAYGLDLLAALLAEGRSSPLVRELREERQLVQDVVASFSLQRDCSLFTIQAWLDAEQVDRVEAIICDRLSTLASTGPTPADVQRAKRLLVNDYIFSTESPGQVAGLYGYYSTIAQPQLCATYVPTLQRCTSARLAQLAQRYLSPQRYVSLTLQPA